MSETETTPTETETTPTETETTPLKPKRPLSTPVDIVETDDLTDDD